MRSSFGHDAFQVSMPQAYNGGGLTKVTGNVKKDIKMNSQGYKYPDRVYGHKFNAGYDKDHEKASLLKPKSVHKPIRFSNLQSQSYYQPTIVTREYQREMPPNLIRHTTRDHQTASASPGRKAEWDKAKTRFKLTSYA